jgi:transposase InsO family protein
MQPRKSLLIESLFLNLKSFKRGHMFSMKVERKFQLLGVDLYTGIPEEIISDEGGEFNAKSIYQNLYDIFKIKKLTTTSYHQQANGQCERFNRTMSI